MADKPVKRSDLTNEPMPDETQIVRLVYHQAGDRHEFECLKSEMEWIDETGRWEEIAVVEVYYHGDTKPSYYLPFDSVTFWEFMEMWKGLGTASKDNEPS